MKSFRYLSTSASKLVRICGLAVVCAALAGPAYADGGGDGGGGDGGGGDHHGHHHSGGGNSGSGGAAPEIDPNSLAGALTLLGSGALVLSDRRRRK